MGSRVPGADHQRFLRRPAQLRPWSGHPAVRPVLRAVPLAESAGRGTTVGGDDAPRGLVGLRGRLRARSAPGAGALSASREWTPPPAPRRWRRCCWTVTAWSPGAPWTSRTSPGASPPCTGCSRCSRRTAAAAGATSSRGSVPRSSPRWRPWTSCATGNGRRTPGDSTEDSGGTVGPSSSTSVVALAATDPGEPLRRRAPLAVVGDHPARGHDRAARTSCRSARAAEGRACDRGGRQGCQAPAVVGRPRPRPHLIAEQLVRAIAEDSRLPQLRIERINGHPIDSDPVAAIGEALVAGRLLSLPEVDPPARRRSLMPEGDTVARQCRVLHEALAGAILTTSDLRVPRRRDGGSRGLERARGAASRQASADAAMAPPAAGGAPRSRSIPT